MGKSSNNTISQAVTLGLTFDDVLLEPRESHVSRDDISLETKLTKKINLKIPILSAAMDTVSEEKMAIALGKLGGMAVIHRNCSIEEQVRIVSVVKSHKVLVGAAVGAGDLERAKALDQAGADAIFVDTAHAHNIRTIEGAKEIKKHIKAELIVGNVATKEAALALVKFADGIKVGIGPGSICTTRVVAGIGVPQLTAVMNVYQVAKEHGIPVIADGGIKYSGDAVKALAGGASSIMIGSMLAGTYESPGKVIKINGEKFKSYRGMGSLAVMKGNQSSDRYFQKNSKNYVPEGVEAAVAYKGSASEIIEQITGGIKSGMGYIGASSINEMPKRARFIQITNAGLAESHPHSILITKKAPNYSNLHK
ncbi:MAG: IMP dehydrogenase [bacterium]|nr:IMP dehydrogenase [bacterium]